jgi:hypothetical protein
LDFLLFPSSSHYIGKSLVKSRYNNYGFGSRFLNVNLNLILLRKCAFFMSFFENYYFEILFIELHLKIVLQQNGSLHTRQKSFC